MANLTEVQLPNGTTYKLVDDESGYITEAEVEGMIGDKADKTLVSYCSCSTAAATAQKEVVAPEGWVLESGRIIAVKFVNTNTAQNPTLKVGTADAKSIYYNNAVVTTGSLFAGGEADRVTLYIYDGTRFVWLGHSIDTNTTYSAMSVSELTTGTATSLRTVRADYLKTGINTLVSGKADKTDIATVESGTTASRAYSAGELVYVSGTLYRVKTAIASGATFTVGTNVEVTNVSGVLSKMSSFLYSNTTTSAQLAPSSVVTTQLAIPTALADKTIDAIIPICASPQAHTTSYGIITSFNENTRDCIVSCTGTGNAQFFTIKALYIYH